MRLAHWRAWRTVWASSVLLLLTGGVLSSARWTAGAADAPGRRLVVGSEQNFPPLALGQTDATAGGFTVELWKDVAREQGLDYTLRVRPFAQLLQEFKAGQIDVLINLAQSDARREFADFTVPHVIIHGAVFVRRDETRIQSEADLPGKSVIVINADLAHDYAISRGWERHLVPVATAEEGFRLLASGQHDAVLISKLVGMQTLTQARIKGVHVLPGQADFHQKFSFAVRRGEAALLARLNEGLAVSKSSGRYDALYEQWLGVYDPKLLTLWDVFKIGVPLLVGLVVWQAYFLHRSRLNRQRQEAAAALQRSQEHLQAIINSVEGIVWEADAATFRFTFVSPQAERLLGYPVSQWTTEPRFWTNHLHPDDREEAVRTCIKATRERRNHEFEYRMLALDGHEVWLRDFVTVVVEHDRVAKLRGIMVDITVRKQAEQRMAAFASLGRRLNAANDETAAARIIADTADKLFGWDACQLDRYHLPTDQCHAILTVDLINGWRREMSPPPKDATPSPRMRQVLRGQPELTLRREPLTASPDRVPFGDVSRPSASIMAVPLREGGEVFGVLSIHSYRLNAYSPENLAALQDLADHCAGALHRIDEENSRRSAEAALEESRRLLEKAQQVGQIGSWVSDPTPQGRLFWSAETDRIFGFAPGEFDGRVETFFALVHPEDRAAVAEFSRAALAGLHAYELEHRIVRRDGQVRWVHEQADVERDDRGQPVRMIGVVRDITERRQLEEQLRHSQRMEAMGQLAGGIAHDFNNLIGIILGNTELVKLLQPGSREANESLEDVLAASRRARDLVQQILAFSRRQEVCREPTQLHAVVRETLGLLRASLPANVEFRTDIAEVPSVLANAAEIHQVTMNLCTNAWQALKNGGGVIHIALAETEVDETLARRHADLRPDRYVRLTIADNGCGMDAATLARIFEPFFTTKPVGEGTGLGLAVVHGIVKSYAGGITVRSEPGQGTTFDLYFPVLELDALTGPVEQQPVPRGSGERILFVDDEEPLTRVGAAALERLGYRVTARSNPMDALALFQSEPAQFDLIVTDLNMPELNGTELTRKVLAIRPEARLLLTTGYHANITAEVARSFGACELLPKPYDLHSLGEAVHRALTDTTLTRRS